MKDSITCYNLCTEKKYRKVQVEKLPLQGQLDRGSWQQPVKILHIAHVDTGVVYALFKPKTNRLVKT